MRTPTIDILTGAQRRTSGTVSVLGRDPQNDEREWRAQVGVVPQGTAKYSDLTVREIIDHFATFYPDPFPTEQLIDMVGLRAKNKTYTTKLSGGQRRRLDVAVGVVGRPRLLFLDEPTTGLDPEVRREAWELVRLLLDAAQRRGISEIPGLQVTQPSLVAASLARSRVELLTFFRNWMSLIFNMALPVLLMLVFGAVFNQKIPGTNVDYRLLFISGMIGVGVMSTTFQSLALSVTSDRDEGLIRRLAAGNGALRPSDAFRRRALADLGVGGPARGEFLFAARYRLHGADSQFLSGPGATTPPFMILQFVSGVFFPLSMIPAVLTSIGYAFPLLLMAKGLRFVFLPDFLESAEPSGSWDLGLVAIVLIAWTVVGGILAVFAFCWRGQRVK